MHHMVFVNCSITRASLDIVVECKLFFILLIWAQINSRFGCFKIWTSDVNRFYYNFM